jgi:hypothetical protein
MNLMATNIMSGAASDATVISTTGRFDVLKLHEVFLQLLQEINSDLKQALEDAEQLLQRVQITRVFDLTGIIQSVDEFNSSFNDSTDSPDTNQKPQSQAESNSAKGQDESLRVVIPDSEDEDDDIMIDFSSQPVPETSPGAHPKSNKSPGPHKTARLLVIDEFSTALIPGSKRTTELQATLFSFLHLLQTVTANHNIVTVIQNQTYASRHGPTSGNKDQWLGSIGIWQYAYTNRFMSLHIILGSVNERQDSANDQPAPQKRNIVSWKAGSKPQTLSCLSFGQPRGSCHFVADENKRLVSFN